MKWSPIFVKSVLCFPALTKKARCLVGQRAWHWFVKIKLNLVDALTPLSDGMEYTIANTIGSASDR